ncbi:hypothetical protein TcCL_Unassigned03353 [Trypanosoma cruzi]|nr:hypothetical protein TcCL_Unassigned03353 [Trypanosoma cruzi]
MCPHIVDGRAQTLLQVGREDINPPLAGRQGVAVLTSGRGYGGGSGGPVSSVREERHHRHRGLLVIRRARAGMSKSGRESHRAFAQSRLSGHDVRAVPGIESSPHRQAPAMRCARPPFLLGIPPVRSPDCSEKVHVPDWAALLREGSCNHGLVVSGLIA